MKFVPVRLVWLKFALDSMAPAKFVRVRFAWLKFADQAADHHRAGEVRMAEIGVV